MLISFIPHYQPIKSKRRNPYCPHFELREIRIQAPQRWTTKTGINRDQATTLTPTQGNLHVRLPINARNHPIPTPIDRVSGGGRAVNIFPLLKSNRHLSDQ